MSKTNTPALDHLSEVNDQMQICGEFLEFLEKKYAMFERKEKSKEPLYLGIGDYINKEHVLAEFFEIDMKELEKERMLLLQMARQQAQEAISSNKNNVKSEA